MEQLRRGDLVEVRDPAEILATLDPDGAVAGLPFMPEMAAYCGRRFTVRARAEKICDTIGYTGSRRLPDAVLLDDLRCDGAGHDGCQAECLFFWNELWLRKVAQETAQPSPTQPRALAALLERVSARTRVDGRYRCQATELQRCTEHLKLWDPRTYVREYTSGNVSFGHFLKVTSRAAVKEPMRKLGLVDEVHVRGNGKASAPLEALNLQPGELVQVKSKEEIAQTLNGEGRNKGLWFDREMLPYCGQVHRVRQRISRFINDQDGRMVVLKNDCVTLEDVICSGDLSLRRWFCPRAIFPFWRECWLRRVEPAQVPAGTQKTALRQ